MSAVPLAAAVLRLRDVEMASLAQLLHVYGLELRLVSGDGEIPGSFWGESEAGLIGTNVYCRLDTPLHSLLHETCHAICMDERRRNGLHRDAGGDYAEENAVCYLQILLADHIAGVGASRMCADMDIWGYTFRLGSARAWFDEDAQDARQWLRAHALIDVEGRVTFRCRI